MQEILAKFNRLDLFLFGMSAGLIASTLVAPPDWIFGTASGNALRWLAGVPAAIVPLKFLVKAIYGRYKMA